MGCRPCVSTACQRNHAPLTVFSDFFQRKLLNEGRYASISEMAAAEKIKRGYLGTLLRLTLLAPEMVEAILNGRQPEGVMLPRCWRGCRRGGGSRVSADSISLSLPTAALFIFAHAVAPN